MRLFIILTYNIVNKPYLSSYVESRYHIVTLQTQTRLYEYLITVT